MSYPCHICAGTMIQGIVYDFPRKYDPSVPSCGKVYIYPSFTAVIYGPTPPPVLVTCNVCKGTGMVDERRYAARRQSNERRSTA